jgi:uncharacterized phage protein (TIGR02220 family)
MPLYIGDYLAGTSRLTVEQHGAYLLLIMDYWMNGPLPDSDQVLANITRMNAEQWECSKHILKHFFRIENGCWKHKRIEEELAQASAKKAMAQEKATKAASARWKNGKNNNQNAPSNAPSIKQAMHEECPSPSPSPSPSPIKDVLKHSCPAEAEPVSDKTKKNHEVARLVISHLNSVSGKSFKTVKSNLRLISGRLSDGNSYQDLALVAEHKVFEWAKDPRMRQYIQPATIYGAEKFDGYLQAAIEWDKNGRQAHERNWNSGGDNQQKLSTVERNSRKGAEIEARLMREIAEIEAAENDIGSCYEVVDPDGRDLRSCVG